VPRRRDAGLKVDDPHVGRPTIPFGQHVAPNVRIADRPRDRPVGRFRKLDVMSCILGTGLVKRRIACVTQNLIDAPTRHDIAAQGDRHSRGASSAIGIGQQWRVRQHAVAFTRKEVLGLSLELAPPLSQHCCVHHLIDRRGGRLT
jgi:hypothetical protein